MSEALTKSEKKLEKLVKVRRLFVWPMTLWFFIMLLDFLIYVIDIEELHTLRTIIATLAFYSLPLFLLYIAFATFYSSYRILESRGHKNIATFFLFQFVAFFAIDQLGIKVPSLGRDLASFLTVAISIVIVLAVLLIERSIELPSDFPLRAGKDNRDTGEPRKATPVSPARASRDPKEITGMVIAALFSIVIASMIYFRVKGGIAFVSWGVGFGVLLAAMKLKGDKLILCFLYFLDPQGGESLYQLIKLKERVQGQKDQSDLEVEVGALHKEEMAAKVLRLANELEQELFQLQFKMGEQRVKDLIQGLRDAANLSPEEQEVKIAQITGVIGQLRLQQAIPRQLPEADYSSRSLGEKVALSVGLTENEIKEAIAERLIDEKQYFLWTPPNQSKIRIALADFDENRFKGTPPIYVAESIADYMLRNKFILERIVEVVSAEDGAILNPIRGGEGKGLLELEVSTVMRLYSCVVRRGAEGSLLLLGVFEKPPDPGGSSSGERAAAVDSTDEAQ
jgi:hypothetical protein